MRISLTCILSIGLISLTGCTLNQNNDSQNPINDESQYSLPSNVSPAPAPTFSDTEQKSNF